MLLKTRLPVMESSQVPFGIAGLLVGQFATIARAPKMTYSIHMAAFPFRECPESLLRFTACGAIASAREVSKTSPESEAFGCELAHEMSKTVSVPARSKTSFPGILWNERAHPPILPTMTHFQTSRGKSLPLGAMALVGNPPSVRNRLPKSR
jgi:hypothetical protein